MTACKYCEPVGQLLWVWGAGDAAALFSFPGDTNRRDPGESQTYEAGDSQNYAGGVQ
jgi:hypothetical protein